MPPPSRTTGGKSQCGREKAAGRQWTRGEGSEQPPRPAQERRVGRANHPGKSGRDVGARAAGGPRHRMHADAVLQRRLEWAGPGLRRGGGEERRRARGWQQCGHDGRAPRGYVFAGRACRPRGRASVRPAWAAGGRQAPGAAGTAARARNEARRGGRRQQRQTRKKPVWKCGMLWRRRPAGRPGGRLGRRWPAGEASLAT